MIFDPTKEKAEAFRKEKKRTFLAALIQAGGNVSTACDEAGLDRRKAYEWRSNDVEFAAKWDDALNQGLDALEGEARRRAFEGVEEPVFYKGEVVGYIRKYSDSLIMFMLKAYRPQFRDRVAIDVTKIDADLERELAELAAGSEGLALGEIEGEAIN